MTQLILPDSEPTTASLIIPNRRTFMQTLTAAFTGAVVAPVILPAANLMQIHSPLNRLIVAFRRDFYGDEEIFNNTFPSFLNLTDYTERSFRAWEALHHHNVYSLVRQGGIRPYNEGKIGGLDWRGTPLEIKERHKDRREWVLREIAQYEACQQRQQHRERLIRDESMPLLMA